jgi:hypothetical protein
MNDYLFQLAKRPFRFLRGRGHGIHSPFVFELVTSVLREKAGYYAFRDLETTGKREGARCRLLFRLAEREGYRRALLVGEHRDVPARYLSAVSREMTLLDGDARPGDDGSWELFHAGRLSGEPSRGEWEGWLARRDTGRACAVIADIHASRVNRALWERFREESCVEIDMTWYGLLFFDRRLQPGRYAL